MLSGWKQQQDHVGVEIDWEENQGKKNEKEQNIKKGRSNGSRRRYYENIWFTRLIVYATQKLRIQQIPKGEYHKIRNEVKLSSSNGAPNNILNQNMIVL